MKKTSKYEKLGVDADKGNVRAAFKGINRNDVPGTFVNVVYDRRATGMVKTLHVDGDGSKFIQRLLDHAVNGDPQVLQGMVDDSWGMNMGDVAASGFVFEPLMIANLLNLNFHQDLKEIIMEQIAHRVKTLIELYEDNGFMIEFMGGETADLRDQVRSGVFDTMVATSAKVEDLVKGDIVPGDKIYGLASNGRALWEPEENSGLMSNGLTLARSCLMRSDYNIKYTWLHRGGSFFSGRYRVNEKPETLGGLTVSQSIISPTRQWAIFIRKLIERLKENDCQSLLHGISQNTGGGATKIKQVGQGGISFVKKMPDPPAIFQLIQWESKETWEHMFQDFNCGVGIDVVGADDPRFAEILQTVSDECQIELYGLGECFLNEGQVNQVILCTPYGEFTY